MIHSPRQRRYVALSAFLSSLSRAFRSTQPRQRGLKFKACLASAVTTALFSTLLVVGMAAPASAAAAAGSDSCGNDPAGNPAFNESTLVKAAAVVGSGANAKLAIFSDDENGTLLGIGATAMPNTPPAAHVNNPSLGDTTKLDPAGRPQYPALFITDQGTSMPAVPITTGDWQNGGAPVTQLQDVFGSWVVGSYDAQGNYQKPQQPPFKTTNGGTWTLGAGSDPLPTTNSPTSFVGTGNSSPSKTEGYGSEFRWDANALGLTPGHFYRVQIMTHDGDQNKTGGDVGEACLTLSIPGNAPGQLTIVKSDDTNHAVNAGGSFNFLLAVSNTGQGDAVNAKVTDTLPAGIVSNGAPTTTGGGTCALAGQKITCTYASIPKGGGATVTIPVKADGTVCGKITNTGAVQADNIAQVQSSDDVTVSCPPNLTIVKSANATTVNAGDSFDYTLAVANTGQGAANATSVKDTIPTGLTIGTVTPSVGTCSTAGQAVTCNLGTLAPAATASIKIHVTTTPAACGIVKNTGTIEASNNAKVTSNEVDVTVVCPNPSLAITKSASATTVTQGDPFDYTLVVTSTGGATATAVNVTDDIPAGLTIVGTPTTTAGTCDAPSGQHVSCNVGDLAAANAANGTKSVTIVIHISTVGAPCGVVTNTGHASASNVTTVDSNPVDVTIDCPVNGQLDKTNDGDGDGSFHKDETAPLPGMDVPFHVVLTNTSAVPVVIESISDAFGTSTVIPQCVSAFVGQTVAPGASIPCDFTLQGYSPAAGSSLENTATVTVHDASNPGKKKTVESKSTVRTAATPPLSLTVVKTNDANGDGIFTKDETGVAQANVNFRVSITNSSAVPVVIDSVTDVWPGATEFAPACAASIVGTTLAANGGTVSCDFTVATYVPVSTDGAKVNTVTVTGHQPGDPGNKTTQKDTSTVRGEPPAVLGTTVIRALPRTGAANTVGLVGIAVLLLGLGLGLTLLSGRIPQAAVAFRSSVQATPVMFSRSVLVVERRLDRVSRRKLKRR